MAVDIGEDVFDKNLAAQLFAEKAHVAADDGTEIQQDRQLARCQRAQKLLEGFGGEDRIIDRHRRAGTDVQLGLSRSYAV